jgi:hypothetical protein
MYSCDLTIGTVCNGSGASFDLVMQVQNRQSVGDLYRQLARGEGGGFIGRKMFLVGLGRIVDPIWVRGGGPYHRDD